MGALALITALGVGAGVYTQTTQPQSDRVNPNPTVESEDPKQHPTTQPEQVQHGQQLVDCATLNTHHQQLMTDVETFDKELDTLVSSMRGAKNDREKLDATVAVVDKLVTQGSELHKQMMTVHHETFAYMMGHREGQTTMVEPCPITPVPESQLAPDPTMPQAPNQPTPPQSPEMGPPAPNRY